MSGEVVMLGIIPRAEAYDVRDPNLAADFRAGKFDRTKLGEMFEHIGFAQWFERQGLALWRRGVTGPGET